LFCSTREAKRRIAAPSHHSETASSQATKPSGVGNVWPFTHPLLCSASSLSPYVASAARKTKEKSVTECRERE